MAKKKPPEALEAIKRLIIFALRREGVTSEELGKILDMPPSEIRRNFSLKKRRK